MDWQKQYDVDTPELVPVRYDVVGLGSRFVGLIIDTTVIHTVVLLLVLLGILVLSMSGVAMDFFIGFDALGALAKALIAFLFLFYFAFYWGYHIFYESTRLGRTPGKRYAGTQVVKQDGSPITFRDALIRNLLRIVDSLPMAYLTGAVCVMRSPHGQRLGDKLAGTLVVRNRGTSYLDNPADEPSLALPVAPAPAAPGWNAPAPGSVPAARIADKEYEIIINFLKRREGLDPDKRLDIARRIAHQIAYKYQIHGYDPRTPERFLEQLLAGR